MAMPRSLRIGPYRFKVTRTIRGGIDEGYEDDMDEPLPSLCPLDPSRSKRTIVGLCSYVKQHIYVSKTLAEDVGREVLLHEILHALWGLVGFPDGNQRLAKFEEQVVSALAPALVDVLRRNPKLVEFLTER